MKGELMAGEMAEQPDVLRGLLARRLEIVDQLTQGTPDAPRGVVLVARGSSDNAAIYGRYVIEVASSLPVTIAAPSLVSVYRAPTDYRGFIAVAISQSGETPEIVTVLERLQEMGARGIAVTNSNDSPLARAAHLVVGLDAGRERAVPATKTFTAQLAVFGFLAEALGSPPWIATDWESVPSAVAAVLADPSAARDVAERIGDAPGIICVGRGFLFPVALEAALKLKETSRILAEGYSAADLRHGPIAVVEEEFPVLIFAAHGPTLEDVQELVATLQERRARTFVVGDVPGADVPVPGDLPEALGPIPAAVQAQLVALWLARHRGLDPDRPSGLSKVTRT
jgi:glucosamine--fructose-6-phosphate aminotransferase (isomerizing)